MGRRDLRLYKTLLVKAYFDKGLNLTNYFKYIIAFFGIFNLINAREGVIIVLVYLLFCFILGFFWYKFKLIDTENEISNHFNPFQIEVRKRLKARRKQKV